MNLTLTTTKHPLPENPNWTWRTSGHFRSGKYVAPHRNELLPNGLAWAVLLERSDGIYTLIEVFDTDTFLDIATEVAAQIDRDHSPVA